MDGPIGFGGERWTYDEARGQYYFHQFFPGQPDLNFHSEELQLALLDVARFWLEQGVDGFRLDVADRYVENLPHCLHQPGTLAFHRRLRAVLDEYPARAMVGEVMGDLEKIIELLGDGDDSLHMIFNFGLMTRLWGAVRMGEGEELARVLTAVLEQRPPGGLHAINLGNHDVPRFAALAEGDVASIKLAASAQLTLPGAPFVYYGEELGMQNGTEIEVDWRDGSRTPMQWDSTPGAGFTTGRPFLPLAPKHEEANVADQLLRDDSILAHYRRLISIRKASPALQEGTFEPIPADRACLLPFWRRHPGGDRLVVLHFCPDSESGLSVSLPRSWTGSSGLLDELAGALVGEVRDGAWSTTLQPLSGLILSPNPGEEP